MQKNKVLAILCLLSAIILGLTSSLVTAKLFMSFDSSYFKYVLLFVGICIDFGKFAFPAIAIFQYQKSKYLSVLIYAGLAIACIGVSFLASMSYDFNQANTITNESITSSNAYQRNDTVFKTTTDSVNTLKNDISNLKINRKESEKTIRNDYSGLIATARKLNMLTGNKDSVAELTKQRDIKIAKLDSDIQNKEQELNKTQSNLSSVNSNFADVANQVKTTKGIMSLAIWFNPTNPDKALGQINFIKNLLIELIAIAFSMAFGSLISHNENIPEYNNYTSIKDIIKPISNNGNLVTANDTSNTIGFKAPKKYSISKKSLIQSDKHNNNIIGFKSTVPLQNNQTAETLSNTMIKDKDIQIYVDCMHQTKKGNISVGHQRIADITGLEKEDCRKIKAHLERIGTIRTDGNRTLIL